MRFAKSQVTLALGKFPFLLAGAIVPTRFLSGSPALVGESFTRLLARPIFCPIYPLRFIWISLGARAAHVLPTNPASFQVSGVRSKVRLVGKYDAMTVGTKRNSLSWHGASVVVLCPKDTNTVPESNIITRGIQKEGSTSATGFLNGGLPLSLSRIVSATFMRFR